MIQIEHLQSKTNLPILKVNDYFIHSKYDPLREAQQLAQKIYRANHVHLIFGYGYGYLDEALHSTRQFNEPIVFIDPLFRNQQITVQKENDQTLYLTDEIIEHFERFCNTYFKEAHTRFHVSCLPNYDKLFPEAYKQLLQNVKVVQNKSRVNDFTLIRFAHTWQTNFIQNLKHLATDRSLQQLENAYNYPVVIASGGPSLKKQLPLLKKVRQHIILIAAGSTINSLLSENIEPDYVVTIDGGSANYEHFKDLKLQHANVIYYPFNHPLIRNSFEPTKGYFMDLNGFRVISNYLDKVLQLKLPRFHGGGSVANAAFSIGRYISNNAVALIGQDLAFTNNSTHADGNKHTQAIDEQYLKAREAFKTEGYYGEEVWTTPVFYSMKLDFEALIEVENNDAPFFNCTEGGIKLDGFPQIPFSEFVARYVQPNANVAIIQPNESIENFNVIEVLQKDLVNYRRILEICEKSKKTLKSNKLNNEFSPKVLKKLEKLDEEFQSIVNGLPIESITVPISMNVIRNYLPKVNETQAEKYARIYKQNEELYTQLISAINITINIVKEELSTLEGGN